MPEGADLPRPAEIGITHEPPALSELGKQTEGLAPFLHLLESSNMVRKKIEDGALDGLTSREVYEVIWRNHTGQTPQEQAVAFAEGGGYTVSQWLEVLQAGATRPTDSASVVREVDNQQPMLFRVPDSLKEEVMTAFFKMADGFIGDPDKLPSTYIGGPYIPAVYLQTHLNFIHPFTDGNGRTAEDWMLWWQKQVQKKDIENRKIQSAKLGEDDFLSLGVYEEPSAEEQARTLRSWYHHGLRMRWGDKETVLQSPPFLNNEFQTDYSAGRHLMFDRTRLMNKFRRHMYAYLAGALEYQGKASDFETFIEENKTKAGEALKSLYISCNATEEPLDNSGIKSELRDLLVKTGPYEYRYLTAGEVIKPEYLEQAKVSSIKGSP